MNARKHILLTGAGFTKNFGAPLAQEVWSLLLGHPYLKDQPRVRDVLRADLDFESVYYRVQSGDFTAIEKEALEKAVKSVYYHIDDIIREPLSFKINIYGAQKMISRFGGTPKEPGFIFTLNQDLFLERHQYNGAKPGIPGIRAGQGWFTSERWTISPATVGMLPEEAPSIEDLLRHNGFSYIKLHGSTNWYGSKGAGMKLVIGQNKQSDIGREPLLARYMELLRAVLCSGQRKLLVIGYGFGDEHINEVLLDAVKQGLQLSVLSPGPADSLKRRMEEKGCQALWAALDAYFQTDLVTLFPEDQSTTPQWLTFQQRFFGSVLR